MQDINDFPDIDINESESKSLPESPCSWNTQATDKDGFNEQFTVRAMNLTTLFKHIQTVKHNLNLQGYKPTVKFGGIKPKPEKDWTGGTCPKDGGRLFRMDTAKGKIIKCENSKWNPFTKQASGCDYIEWPNQQVTPNAPTQTVSGGASPAQVKLIQQFIAEGKLEEDVDFATLDKEEAKVIISNCIKK